MTIRQTFDEIPRLFDNRYAMPVGIAPIGRPGCAGSRRALRSPARRAKMGVSFILKGILCADDARRAVEQGVDGIIVSDIASVTQDLLAS
ncbi:MAG: alpha-hydroxy-acid oxidizing protein [Pseudomonadota bacterium]